jgi:hypothetical protein
MASFRVFKHDISNFVGTMGWFKAIIGTLQKNWLFFKIELELKLGVSPQFK